MGVELLEWGKEKLGVTINEYYGQTESNLMISNCAKIMKVKPGSMGRAVPGHFIEILDDYGNIYPLNTTGSIAFKSPDPVMFLKYWNNESAIKSKFLNNWLISGDLVFKDLDGYFWFIGRSDDVITSAGYRNGPGEIEECILKHTAVSVVAVIGVPDTIRTESIKAFIILQQGEKSDLDHEKSIRSFVKKHSFPHEYPRIIEFVNELPMTATGKIRRNVLRDKN